MNRFQKLACLAAVAVAALSVGAAADAAVIGTSALVRLPPGTPFAAPDAALGVPWVGYTLGLATTAGELIGGVDVTIHGVLHQRWTPGEDDEGNPINVPTGNSGNASNADSHLRAVAGALFGSGPSEDNSLTGSPLANTASATYGVGGFLRGAWVIPNPLTAANIAYIVIPRGNEPNTHIRVVVADPRGNIIGVVESGCSTPFACSPDGPPIIVDADLGTIWLGMNSPPAPTIIMHQFVALDDRPISELTWSIESVTYDGMGTGLLNAPTIDANGKLSWLADGSGQGQYTFRVRATDAGPGAPLHDIGMLKVFLHVPEPASMALVGVALVAVMCIRRKRSSTELAFTLSASLARVLVATLCLFVLLAAAAEASVIGTSALVRNPPGVPFAAVAGANDSLLPAPWVGYTLGLATTAGELIGGIDVSIGGTLHQRWTPGEDDEGNPINVPTGNSGNATNADSHLRALTGALFAAGPSENNSLAGSPLANTPSAVYGVGSSLSGIWGIPGGSQTTTANMAYIVIPFGSQVNTDIRVKVADPQGNIIGVLTEANFPGFEPIYQELVIVDANLGTVWLDMNSPPAPTIIMHQFVAFDDQPISELTWAIESVDYVGTGTGLLNAPTIDANGKLSWLADGSGQGQYTFHVRATDAGPGAPLYDIGMLKVFLHVPEPASMALVGVALVGLGSVNRKRSIGYYLP